MSEKLFHQLLHYREELLSHEFVDAVLGAIHRFEIIRTLILALFAISGLVFLGFTDLTQFNFFSSINMTPLVSEFKNLSSETIGFIIFSMVCSLGLWLVSSDQ